MLCTNTYYYITITVPGNIKPSAGTQSKAFCPLKLCTPGNRKERGTVQIIKLKTMDNALHPNPNVRQKDTTSCVRSRIIYVSETMSLQADVGLKFEEERCGSLDGCVAFPLTAECDSE